MLKEIHAPVPALSKNKLIQITKCLCGKTFAACREPECYSDAEYQKDTRAYIKKGCSVEMVEIGEWSFEKCTCPNMNPVEVDITQLSIFSAVV